MSSAYEGGKPKFIDNKALKQSPQKKDQVPEKDQATGSESI